MAHLKLPLIFKVPLQSSSITTTSKYRISLITCEISMKTNSKYFIKRVLDQGVTVVTLIFLKKKNG